MLVCFILSSSRLGISLIIESNNLVVKASKNSSWGTIFSRPKIVPPSQVQVTLEDSNLRIKVTDLPLLVVTFTNVRLPLGISLIDTPVVLKSQNLLSTSSPRIKDSR